MRCVLNGLLIVALCLACTGPACAGLYNTAAYIEPDPLQLPVDQIAFTLREMRALALPATGVPKPGTYRFNYQMQMDRLEAQGRDGVLSTLDRVNLAACYLRFNKTDKAVSLLRAADQKHFLVQANLATAYALRNELELAIRHQEQALLLWPAVFAPWSGQHLAFYRQCERYNLKLLQSRLKEEILARERGRPGKLPLDPLFPGVRFVGPDLKTYEAGNLAPEMADRLPTDANYVVLQLCWWRPDDWRLHWLLGELLNAHGKVEQAYKILDEMGGFGNNVGSTFEGWVEHRQVLEEAQKAYTIMRRPTQQAELLLMLAAPAPLAPAASGAIAHETAMAVPLFIAPLVEQGALPGPGIEPAPPPAAAGPPSVLPDWRHVTIGFLAGSVVTALLGLQVQEWRRRRAAASVHRVEEPAVSPLPLEEEAGIQLERMKDEG